MSAVIQLKLALSLLATLLLMSSAFAQRSSSGAASSSSSTAVSQSSSSATATGGSAEVINNITIDLGEFIEISRCVRRVDLHEAVKDRTLLRLHSIFNRKGNYATTEEILNETTSYPLDKVYNNKDLDGSYVMIFRHPLVIEVTVGYVNKVTGNFVLVPQPKLIRTTLSLMSDHGSYSQFWVERPSSITYEKYNPIEEQYLTIETRVEYTMRELAFCK